MKMEIRDFESAVRNQSNRGSETFDNLELQLMTDEFGDTFTEKVFAPIIRKFQRHERVQELLRRTLHEMFQVFALPTFKAVELFEKLLRNKGLERPTSKENPQFTFNLLSFKRRVQVNG